MQSAIQIKSDKNNFTCIQCAGKERFKTLLKQSLDIDDTQCDRYSLLTTVSKSGTYSSVQRSSNAVIFAEN